MNYIITEKGKRRIQYQIRKMKKGGAEHIPTMEEILQDLNEKGVKPWWGGTYYKYGQNTRYGFELKLDQHVEPDLSGIEDEATCNVIKIALRNGLKKDDLLMEADLVDDTSEEGEPEWQYMILMGYFCDTLRAAAELM